MATIVSALFDDALDARAFYHRLRDELRVPEDAITIAGLHDETVENVREKGAETERYAAGVGGGAAAGALLGIAAVLLPGLAPFALAGAAVAASTAIGAAAGGLATWLSGWGVSEEEAAHYERRVEEGAIYVGLDLGRAPLTQGEVLDEIHRFHGVFGGREGGAELEPTAAPGLPNTMEPELRNVPQAVTTASTAGYVTPEGGYTPVVSGDTDEHDEREAELTAPTAETIPVDEDASDEGRVVVHHGG